MSILLVQLSNKEVGYTQYINIPHVNCIKLKLNGSTNKFQLSLNLLTNPRSKPKASPAISRFAEGEGFEPPKGINPCWFSRPVHSARLCHPSGCINESAERVGFEPTLRYERKHAFQACAFSHSATSPKKKKFILFRLWCLLPLLQNFVLPKALLLILQRVHQL